MKKFLSSIVVIVAIMSAVLLTSCEYTRDNGDEWKSKFDISNPNLDNAGTSQDTANSEGWYVTLEENFDGDKLPETFAPSPHGLRHTEYWCDDMVSVENGNAVIKATYSDNHECDICPKNGYFTSGIETKRTANGKSENLFEQAFGYFEARVCFPKSGGMWSAFWLQTDSVGNIGNKGEDGSEIDIYESSFYNTNKSNIGHAIHYDGYANKHKCMDRISNSGYDLYDGFHTFAVKWTPYEYVFFVDGKVSWATDFGGVCKVPAYLRFTNEIRDGKSGPYGQELGKFDGGEFLIDYVKVYQNVNYIPHIQSPSDFK